MADPHPFSRAALNEENVNRFLDSSHRKRDLHALINDVVIMRLHIEGNSFRISPDCFIGMRHLIDETLVLIAMRPALTEDELWIKASVLEHKSPMIPANGNLRMLLAAGIQADLIRLAPKKIPAWYANAQKLLN